ncbi:MAG: hypothetical protein NQU46_06975 [Methanolinea sp.]|nr:hypothetical protein [Methanolinea sp.]
MMEEEIFEIRVLKSSPEGPRETTKGAGEGRPCRGWIKVSSPFVMRKINVFI